MGSHGGLLRCKGNEGNAPQRSILEMQGWKINLEKKPRIEKVVVWLENIYIYMFICCKYERYIVIHSVQCTYLNIMYIMGYHSMQNTTTTWSDPNGNTYWTPGALRVLGISFQNLDIMFFLCSRVSFFLGSVTSRISPHGSKCSFKCFSEIAFGKPWTNTRNLSSLTQHFRQHDFWCLTTTNQNRQNDFRNM